MAFSSTHAAIIMVDVTTDIDADDGGCTLREAIVSINSGSIVSTGCTVASGVIGVNDTITFAPGLSSQTIGISQSVALSVTEDVVISGPGDDLLTIDGTGNGSVFNVSNSTVELNGLTISGGSTSGDGGGVFVSGSIISLDDSTVSNNSANRGGGIFVNNKGIVNLVNSVLSGNTAVTNGGGIFVNDSTASFIACTVSTNLAMDSGGGVYAKNLSDVDPVNLIDSTISGNSAIDGGGIFVSNSVVISGDPIRLILVNSTVSNNEAEDDGGGIAISNAEISLINSTVSYNVTTNLGGGVFITNSGGTATLVNTIVSGNLYTAMGGAGRGAEIMNNGVVTVTSNNNNLLGDNSQTSAQAFVNFTSGDTDIVAASDGSQPASLSSILDSLVDNGGPTQTHALTGGSVAIDAGDDVACASVPVSNLDQRGIARPQGAHCDIGAFELIPPSLTIMKNVNNDHGGIANPADFILRLSGGDYSASVSWDSGDVIVVETDTAYTVSEDLFLGYTQTGIVCRDDGSSDDIGHPVTLNEGQSATCTISNDDDPPGLKIVKEVIGGNAVPEDFTLHLSGLNVGGGVDRTSGEFIDVTSGEPYTLSEDPFVGYTQAGIVCLDSSTGEDLGHPVTLDFGQSATCTISNAYNAYDAFYIIPLPNGGASVFAL